MQVYHLQSSTNVRMKRSIVVISLLLIGVLMPFLSRVPLAAKFGLAWIWRFVPHSEAFAVVMGVFVTSLIPLVLFGVLYVLTRFRWALFLSAAVHYSCTAFFFYDFLENPRDEPLALAFAPIFIGLFSFVAGCLGLLAEWLITRRPKDTSS